MKTIYISVTDAEYEIIRHEGKSRGLKPSVFSRMAIFSHITKYPTKGVFAELDILINTLPETKP